MSEVDRAAKAARAKAMLKKRQQKKAIESSAPVSDVASLPSRTSTPAPSEPLGGEKKQDSSDDILPLVPSPPVWVATPSFLSSAQSPSPEYREVSLGFSPGFSLKEKDLRHEKGSIRSEVAKLREKTQQTPIFQGDIKAAQELQVELERERTRLKSQLEELRQETDTQLKNYEETISLLVSEKAALTSQIHQLIEVETRANNAEESLEQEKTKNTDLESQCEKLHNQINSVTSKLELLQRGEREMNERSREQERQLQLATASAVEARKDAERSQQILKELEEQIQNDDRLGLVEASLKNTQERADELEFQLSRLKRTHSFVEAKKDALDAQLSESADIKVKLETQIFDLRKMQESVLQQLTQIREERDNLIGLKTSLEKSGQDKDATITVLHAQLASAGAEISNQKTQVHTLQNDLRTAQKRADVSERTQQRLQTEGTNLMLSLDELRTKLVELTDDKIQLSENLAHQNRALRDQNSIIANLTTSLEEAKQETEGLRREWKDKLIKAEQKWSQAVTSSSEVEQRLSESQKELDNALNNTLVLEVERQSLRQDAQARFKEIEQLSNSSRSQAAEITKLRYELNERRAIQEEEESMLDQTRKEIELLRDELAMKTAKVEQLRNNQPSSLSFNGSPPSFNEEMLNSLKQQHALDLSASQSQIRALENSVFDAEARAHALQKEVHSLEARLASKRPGSGLDQQSFSPNHYLSRPLGRVQSRPEFGRSSYSSSQRPLAFSRSIFDQSLTPETRHKRKVSLSMLKARIESEVVVAGLQSGPLSPVDSRSESPSEISHHQAQSQHQFLDDSHVFWCSSCSGELVVL